MNELFLKRHTFNNYNNIFNNHLKLFFTRTNPKSGHCVYILEIGIESKKTALQNFTIIRKMDVATNKYQFYQKGKPLPDPYFFSEKIQSNCPDAEYKTPDLHIYVSDNKVVINGVEYRRTRYLLDSIIMFITDIQKITGI